MTFIPSLHSGSIGKEFIFYYFRTDGFFVFALEDAIVEVYDTDGFLGTVQF